MSDRSAIRTWTAGRAWRGTPWCKLAALASGGAHADLRLQKWITVLKGNR